MGVSDQGSPGSGPPVTTIVTSAVGFFTNPMRESSEVVGTPLPLAAVLCLSRSGNKHGRYVFEPLGTNSRPRRVLNALCGCKRLQWLQHGLECLFSGAILPSKVRNWQNKRRVGLHRAVA